MIKQSHQSSMCVKSPQRRSQNLGDDFGDVRKFARNLNTLWVNSHITNKNGTLFLKNILKTQKFGRATDVGLCNNEPRDTLSRR